MLFRADWAAFEVLKAPGPADETLISWVLSFVLADLFVWSEDKSEMCNAIINRMQGFPNERKQVIIKEEMTGK